MKTLQTFALALLLSLFSSAIANSQVGGTWQNVRANTVNGGWTFGADTALLLTDGTVLVHDLVTTKWFRLTPDIKGRYDTAGATGAKWSAYFPFPNIGGKPYAPLYFASAVLADGRLIVEGGEYVTGETNLRYPIFRNMVWSTKGAITNPLQNIAWAAVKPPAGWGDVNLQNGTGDAQATVLSDGTFFLANALTRQQAILDPTTLTWTAADTNKTKYDENDEENWNLLPGRTVLAVDAYTDRPAPGTNSEIYDPTADSWSSAGSTIVKLEDFGSLTTNTHEVGPAVLRPDGTVIAFGSTPQGHNAAYNTNTKMWMAAPDTKARNGTVLNVQDGPASLLPCGKVLVDAGFGLPNMNLVNNGVGVTFFEWDGTNLLQITNPPGNAANVWTYQGRMLVLPTGQVLYTDNSKTVQVYTPDPNACPPDPGSAPTIQNWPALIVRGNTTYQVSGTQFNGKSQGAAYGNDAQSNTNYPLVRLYNPITGDVFYCQTHDHSSMGVATGALVVTTNFECPNGEVGPNLLYVVANGIASSGKAVLVF
jgi:hypothetical protein